MDEEIKNYIDTRFEESRTSCIFNMESKIRETINDRLFDFINRAEQLQENNQSQDKKINKILENQEAMMIQQNEMFPKYKIAVYLYKGALWLATTGVVLWGGLKAFNALFKK